MTRPPRPAPAILAAALVGSLVAFSAATSARAADALVVPVRPVAPEVAYVPAYVPAAPVPYDPYDGQPILPLAVLSGPGYGLTGRDYYFDERSEHALRAPRLDRRAYRRAAYR